MWGGRGIPHLENILRLRVRRRGHNFELGAAKWVSRVGSVFSVEVVVDGENL